MHKLSTAVINRCSKPVGHAQDYARYLTASVRSRLADGTRHEVSRAQRMVLWAALCLVGTTSATAAQNVNTTTSIDSLKLYAHSRIVNYKEFICFNKIITKESQWLHSARNGSHYGLGQMRSTWYRNLDPFRQIDATILYNVKRYQTHCKAWAFHLKHGYY
jgi:hypothetical protein